MTTVRRESSSSEGDWSWRDGDRSANAGLGLLYEPGNWGDVLKGTWAEVLAAELATTRAEGSDPLRYVDAFAGAPDYPLLASVSERLSWLDVGRFVARQRTWVARGRLASTASIVADVLRELDTAAELDVYDLDETRRAAWRGVEGVSINEASSGLEVLERADGDLILVDPYDFASDGTRYRDAIARLARKGLVLVYLYNKSPRGPGQLRHYERLKQSFVEVCKDVEFLVGRIPSDIVLPRAFHEMWLLGPREIASPLAPELARATKQLACKMSTSGAFESPRDS